MSATEAPDAPASDGPIEIITTVPPAVVTSRLVALPEELVSNISVRLGSDDVFALRLTCRDIEAKTFHEFATEYFTAKCFIFTTESLKVFIHIANHHKLRDYLTEVYFAPAQIIKPTTNCEHDRTRRSNVRQRQAVALYIADQGQLHASGDDKRPIIEAFSKLPSMRLLGVVDTLSALHEGAECRGMQNIFRSTGCRPRLSGTDHNLVRGINDNKVNFTWLSHVWTTVIHALAESRISTVTQLVANLESGLSPLMDLKFKKTATPLIAPILNNLRHRACQALKILASTVPNVTSLKLSFDVDHILGFGSPDISRKLFKAFMDNINVESLTKLSLNFLGIDVKTLASVVCKLKLVQFLTFHTVDITNGGHWIPVLKAVAQLPFLNHLHLQYLTEAVKRVYFLDQPAPEEGEWPDIFGQANDGDNEDQWNEDDVSESDEELPQLVSNGPVVDEVPELVPTGVTVTGGPIVAPTTFGTIKAKSLCKDDGGKEYKAPGYQSYDERGYYVCLQGREAIQREILHLIQKYNTEENPNEDDINNDFFNTILGGAAVGAVV